MTHRFCCPACGCSLSRQPQNWQVPANDNRAPVKIKVPSDALLRRIAVARRIGIAVAGLGFSRRELPNQIADALFGHEEKHHVFCWSDGEAFTLDDTAIDDAFRDDGDFRWVSQFFRRCREGELSRAPMQSVLPRLRLMLLFLRVRYPEIADSVEK